MIQRLFLFESEAHAFGFFCTANFADNCFVATFTLGNRLRKTHLRFLERHNTTLQNLAVEPADEVLIGLVLVFSSYFDCHISCIISNFLQSANPHKEELDNPLAE